MLLATASRLSVTLNLLPRRRRTVWVRNYLKKRNTGKYSVYQRCYQDQGVRDQDQTKTRQAETKTKTKTSKKWS